MLLSTVKYRFVHVYWQRHVPDKKKLAWIDGHGRYEMTVLT